MFEIESTMDRILTPREYQQLSGVKPRKRFGQHFLAQPATARQIVAGADLDPADVVVEVGPGLGALTQFILPQARLLHLVEFDRDLADYLTTLTHSFHGRVHVHQQDILTFDFRSLGAAEQARLVVLGNLPYNITSPLIFRLLESRPAIKRAVFMVQKEVGERLTADPGTKDYGVLSVLLGVYTRASKLFAVGPEQFHPRPKVNSLVVRMDFPGESRNTRPSFKFFRTVVNSAFQQRRKTLQNSLKSLFGKNSGILEQAFTASGIDPMRRPETLTSSEFLRLAELLETLGASCSRHRP